MNEYDSVPEGSQICACMLLSCWILREAIYILVVEVKSVIQFRRPKFFLLVMAVRQWQELSEIFHIGGVSIFGIFQRSGRLICNLLLTRWVLLDYSGRRCCELRFFIVLFFEMIGGRCNPLYVVTFMQAAENVSSQNLVTFPFGWVHVTCFVFQNQLSTSTDKIVWMIGDLRLFIAFKGAY